MSTTQPRGPHSNAYSLFILVVTILSLLIMALELLPFGAQTKELLVLYDNCICAVFLIDFALELRRAESWRAYFFQGRGWLDLLGSIPNLNILQVTSLLRLARLSRLSRIARLVGEKDKDQLLRDLVRNRAQYAVLITILCAFLVISAGSIVVLQAEAGSPNANIKTAGEALWWAIVTITTVGYGDYAPTTAVGRIAAVFVMFTGIGIIGSLASIMASLLVAPAPVDEEPAPIQLEPSGVEGRLASVERELQAARGDLAALRLLLGGPGGAPSLARDAEPATPDDTRKAPGVG